MSENHKSKVATRASKSVWLVGVVNATFPRSSQLPTLRDTLAVFFHHHSNRELSLKECARQTISQLTDIWNKAALSTSRSYDTETRLLKIRKEWQGLKKAYKRRSKQQIDKEDAFSNKLDRLFDIAPCDAETIINIPEDLEFLQDQRNDRKLFMGREDIEWSKSKRARLDREESLSRQKEKAKEDSKLYAPGSSSQASSEVMDSSDEDADCVEEHDDEGVDEFIYIEPRKQEEKGKGKKQGKELLSKAVMSALDRTKVSDRNAVYLLASTAHSLGHDVNDLPLSRSTLRRSRSETRREIAEDTMRSLHLKGPITVHWDGKLLPSLTGREKVDRLPVVVTWSGGEHLLGVPATKNGTGEQQTSAVLKCLERWGIAAKITCMCFDTTASNTGHIKGACTLIEGTLKRELLHLACRHHVLEIIIEKVFKALNIAPSTGPDILLFKRFKEKWSSIDTDNFCTAEGKPEIEQFHSSTIEFAKKQLLDCQPRDD